MSLEEQDRQLAGTATQASADPATPTGAATGRKYPPGVVLGKDGKPCRSCTSGAAFASWTSSLKGKPGNETVKHITATTTTANATNSGLPSDCPPDVERLGNSAWTLLHTIAASYPETPSATQKDDLRDFMRTFSRLYPCWVCAEDFQAHMQRDRPKVGGRGEFGDWLCKAHNEVNRKLGKEEFDCSRWEERWRSGWKDGRCD